MDQSGKARARNGVETDLSDLVGLSQYQFRTAVSNRLFKVKEHGI